MGKGKKTNRDYSEESENDDMNYECIYGNYESVREILERDEIKITKDHVKSAIINRNYKLVAKLIVSNTIKVSKIEKLINIQMIKYLIKKDAYVTTSKLLESDIVKDLYMNSEIIKLMIRSENEVTITGINENIITKKNIRKYAETEEQKENLTDYLTPGTDNYFHRVLDKAIKENDLDVLEELDYKKHLETEELLKYITEQDEEISDFFKQKVVPLFDMNEIYNNIDDQEYDYEEILSILLDDNDDYNDIDDYFPILEHSKNHYGIVDYLIDKFSKKKLVKLIKKEEYDREDFSISLSDDEELSSDISSSCEY